MTAATLAEPTVTQPWENTRKRVSRDGLYPWSVTLKRGALAETRTFWDLEEAEALVAEFAAAGFRVLGERVAA